MIQVNNISKGYAGRELIEDGSFSVSPNERIGVIGRNGSGKSTLFKMILGIESPDSGEVIIPKNYLIKSLDQYIKFTHETVLAECMQELGADEQYDEYKVEKVLFGLGFTKEDMNKDPLSFSGGYQIRINLAKALIGKPGLLLLDEPTNYLDILSLRWLKNFLRKFDGEVMLITHDRGFMNDIITHTVGLRRRKIKKIAGDTHQYEEQMKLEDDLYEQTRANQEKKKKELEDFVTRFKAKASKAAQAQSRVKQLEKMQEMDKLEVEANLSLNFNYKETPAKVLMQLKDLSFGYKPDNKLFKDLSFDINKNDRIGIIGKNGKGKSTLLNVIGGFLESQTGQMKSHPSLFQGYLGQTNISRLNSNNTIAQEITECNAELSFTQVRQICGAMMFSGDMADKKIEVLSGGEKSRVMLGKILAYQTNLLLLDEPTNHLDIESVSALMNGIKEYQGAVLIVTHDEVLLHETVNKLLVFQKDGVEIFDGSYQDFLDKIGWEEELADVQNDKKPKLTKKEKQRLAQERVRALSPIKKQVQGLENEIIQKEENLESLNTLLIKSTEENNYDLIREYSQQIKESEQVIEQLFTELDQKTEELHKAEESFKITD